MKSVVAVNCSVPTAEAHIEYESDRSLIDFDIIIFDPRLPFMRRLEFTGGGSCIDIDAGVRLTNAMTHWKRELMGALRAGKTVFFLLDKLQTDQVAVSYETPRKGSRNYSTRTITSYDVLPAKLATRNAKGEKVKTSDPLFTPLISYVQEFLEYRILLEDNFIGATVFTRDGKNVLGGITKIKDAPGRLVLLPYFEMPSDMEYEDDEPKFTNQALKHSTSIVKKLLAIDRGLKEQNSGTPKPDWLSRIAIPEMVVTKEREISTLETQIGELEASKAEKEAQKAEVLQFQSLLFENGTPLENVIERALKLLGYEVQNFSENGLEIDHIIVAPSGLRMIGETEGKDNQAIGISKFRQLESNINEDFERDEVSEPAKGVLFGNGYRLTEPSEREIQFTDKCRTNAKRLGTALVATTDLYHVVLHTLNHPDDEEFKQACRTALETTQGEMVKFPALDHDT